MTLIGFALADSFKLEAMALIPQITVVVNESLKMMMYPLKMYLKQVAVDTVDFNGRAYAVVDSRLDLAHPYIYALDVSFAQAL